MLQPRGGWEKWDLWSQQRRWAVHLRPVGEQIFPRDQLTTVEEEIGGCGECVYPSHHQWSHTFTFFHYIQHIIHVTDIMRNCCKMERDRFMWYTTFWPPMSANSEKANIPVLYLSPLCYNILQEGVISTIPCTDLSWLLLCSLYLLTIFSPLTPKLPSKVSEFPSSPFYRVDWASTTPFFLCMHRSEYLALLSIPSQLRE